MPQILGKKDFTVIKAYKVPITFSRYYCVNGSQFDTDNDGVGDTLYLDITCQWRKAWSPWPTLPICIITHCVDPFPIPSGHELEQETHEWTPINTDKVYRCTGRVFKDGSYIPTKFFKNDRSLSSFGQRCLPDGTYNFVDIKSNWPVCLEGMFNSMFLDKSFIIHRYPMSLQASCHSN